jgi:hypothetical protein
MLPMTIAVQAETPRLLLIAGLLLSDFGFTEVRAA